MNDFGTPLEIASHRFQRRLKLRRDYDVFGDLSFFVDVCL